VDLTYILVQIAIALVCAAIAASLIPRQIPGKWLGLIVIGFAGVWLGEWLVNFLKSTYELPMPEFVLWDFQGVPVIPAIVGSAIVLYIVTTFLTWGRYRR
jgi:uncharacterized membrane protein YeaQ/YmgE (transglycosylase-associated protein family)